MEVQMKTQKHLTLNFGCNFDKMVLIINEEEVVMDNLHDIAIRILSTYPVKRAAFFGSAARGDMTSDSDIDMLIEFLPDTRGIIFFSLHADLEEAFKKSVDLITYDALQHEAKEKFRNNVIHDARIIYEREN